MCGILVYKNSGNNYFIQKRWQDFTNKIQCNGFIFIHNLLHITGEFSPQPYIQDNIVCLYNGEIYNHKFIKSDGENLIPLYKKYGIDFPKYLDGEWAIALYDFDKGLALFATDLFATKPIWRKGLECANYESGVGGKQIPANNVDFKAYVVKGNEDSEILKQRMKLIPYHQYFGEPEDFREEPVWIKENIEDVKYKISQSVKTDSASLALSKICREAHSEGRKVYLSGQGGDEIIGDYALKPHQSTFKGKFPEKLTLWNNFYDGYQYSYLGKEEYVAGSHSIETHYPFLDRDVVQEFLWLTPKLKNRYYKAPLHEYLMRNNFPNLYNKRVGLSVKL